jgi:hypothetical protein
MNLLVNLSDRLSLLNQIFYFLKKHLIVIFGLGLIAAFGRVLQLGGFGQITPGFNIFLEVVVEFVRVLIFVYVLGMASIRNGALRIKQVLTDKASRTFYWRIGVQKIKRQWVEILVNFFAFISIAWMINYLIDLLAYQTCLYLALKENRILSQTSSEWSIILFVKNISVIPFTITFNALFLLWIVNKFRGSSKSIWT